MASKSGKKSSKGAPKEGGAGPAADNNSPKTLKDRGPMVITIAPNCGGKSYSLNALEEANLLDVAVDNAVQLYEKVPVTTCVHVLEPREARELGIKPGAYADKKNYGKTMLARVMEARDTELFIVTCLFSGVTSMPSAEARLRQIGAHNDFITTIKREHEAGATITSTTIDLHIPEALHFGEEQYKSQLINAARDRSSVFAAANCNLTPAEYSDALALAATNKRRVRFLRWGKEISAVPIAELFARNLQRFLATGRFVDSARIILSHRLATELAGDGSGKVKTHAELAALAGYEMDEAGFVRERGQPPMNPTLFNAAESKWASWFQSEYVQKLDVVDAPPPLKVAPKPVSAPAPAPAPIRMPEVPKPAPVPVPAPVRVPEVPKPVPVPVSLPPAPKVEVKASAVPLPNASKLAAQLAAPAPAPIPTPAPVSAPAPTPAPAPASAHVPVPVLKAPAHAPTPADLPHTLPAADRHPPVPTPEKPNEKPHPPAAADSPKPPAHDHQHQQHHRTPPHAPPSNPFACFFFWWPFGSSSSSSSSGEEETLDVAEATEVK